MKISHKLALGFLLVTLLICLAGQISFHLSRQVVALRTVVLPMEQNVHDLDTEMWDTAQEAESSQMTANRQDANTFEKHADAVEKALANFCALIGSEEGGLTMCAEYQTHWQEAWGLAQRIVRLKKLHAEAQQTLGEESANLTSSLQPGDQSADASGSLANPPFRAEAMRLLVAAVEKLSYHTQQALWMLPAPSEPDSVQTAVAAEVEVDIRATDELWRSSKALIFAGRNEATADWEKHLSRMAEVARHSLALQEERSRLYVPLQHALDAADEIIDTKMRPSVQHQLDLAQRAANHDRRDATAVVLTCVGLSLGICWLVSRHIGGGVSEVIAFAERLAGGDLNARLYTNRNDEFGILAATLNQTASQLAKNEESLRREIMARGRVLEALQESERRFGQIANNIREVFWIVSAETMAVEYVSPAYEAVTGSTCASARENPLAWMEHILVQDKACVAAAFARCAADERVEVEFRFIHPETREVRWLRSRCCPLIEKGRPITRLCGVTEDITERKQVEEGTEELNKRLRELSHQAGMAEVATSVLHNVGNVLNSVNIAIEVALRTTTHIKVGGLHKVAAMLAEHEDDLTTFLTYDKQGSRLPAFLTQIAQHFEKEQALLLSELQELRTHVEHANEIVAMQQSYATSGGLIETLPIDEVIEDAVRMNSAALGRHGAYVVREFDRCLPPVPLDRHKVLQILINFIRNAKYAMDEAEATDKRMTLRTRLTEERYVEVSVIDKGVGIPPENLPRLFEHGFTTRQDGHGFGLHSSALAAKELGGSIQVHSAGSGSGACFSLVLPLPA